MVRYYGGIQLGTGGLVKAYSGDVGEALKQLPTLLKVPRTPSLIHCDYDNMGTVESLISSHNGELLVADYGQQVTLQVAWSPLFGLRWTVN